MKCRVYSSIGIRQDLKYHQKRINTNSEKQLIYWPDYDQSNKITHDYNIQPQNRMNNIINSPVPDNYAFNSEDNTSNIDGNLSGNYTITSNL